MSPTGEPEAMQQALTALCRRVFGGTAEVSALERLSGGASMETWALRYGEQALVLRRAPGGHTLGDDAYADASLSLAGQAELMRCAARAGVSVPAVPATLTPADGLGDGFLMARVQGQALPGRILGQPAYAQAEARLVADCARELARIHAVDAAELGAALALRTPAEQVQGLAQRLQRTGAALPVFALALGWLERHLPPPVPAVVLHGDFRLGNLLVDEQGIAAVLDWELAHRGDPAQDLAYLCTPSWRWGRHERVVGGFGDLPELLAAYRTETGREITPGRLRFWLVYSTLWWGLTCVSMAAIWRDGRDRSLERSVVGRRVSEVEVDLLLLLEEGGDTPPAAPVPPPRTPEPTAGGGTTTPELLQALGEWAQAGIATASDPFRRFESRVAVNALGIARRQALWGTGFDAARRARLAALGLDEPALAARLRHVGLRSDDAATWAHLRQSALEQITIDQPRYAGARVARARWCARADDEEQTT